MKASDHNQQVRFNSKEETVREFAEAAAVDIFQGKGELIRILADPRHQRFKLSPKAHPQARLLLFIPVLRFDDLGPRRWRENNLYYFAERWASSARNCSQLTA